MDDDIAQIDQHPFAAILTSVERTSTPASRTFSSTLFASERT